MKDGFYISSYLHIDELANLTRTTFRHDQNIALWKKSGSKVELIRYWELERITGLKQHDISLFDEKFAINIINQLLKSENISMNDVLDIWGTPRLGKPQYFKNCSYTEQYTYHSLCHLFAALLLDTRKIKNKPVIALSLDGGPDIVTQEDAYTKKYFCGCVYQNGKIEMFPISSPGGLWICASNLFKKREGTLMALASASKSEYHFEEHEDISLVNSNWYLKAKKYVNDLYDQIANISDSDTGEKFNGFDSQFTEEENKISMVMKQIQKVSTRMVIETVREVAEKYNIDTHNAYIALAGGFALNCPTNKALMEQFNFLDLLAPPCVNDSGLALGCGLLNFFEDNREIEFSFHSPFCGEEDGSIDVIKKKYGKFIEDIHEINTKECVADIIQAPIVWFDGKAEIGPRALGHRSILGDPRKIETKEILNQIKQREWWRPVAPIVLEECGNNVFKNFANSEYMLRTFEIRKEFISQIPAVAHLNETARIQSINEKQNPILYHIIYEFYKQSNIPLICNTSLNDRGEPIINRIEEALNFALRKKIKVMYINCYRVKLCNHELYSEEIPLVRDLSNVYPFTEDELYEQSKQFNPCKLKQEDIQFFYWNYKIFNKFDLHNQKDVTRFMRIKNAMINQ